MFFRFSPYGEALPRENGLQGLFNFWPFSNHFTALLCTYVIQVYIYGEPRRIEEKKVQGGTALRGKLAFEVWVALYGIQ